MRQLAVIGALAICSLAVIVETKPFLAVKVVPVPVLVPKINILGLVGKAVHAKAALVGKVVHAKAALVGKVVHAKVALLSKILGAKATLVGHILGSSSSPTIGVVHPPPLFPGPIYPSAAPSHSPPPSTSYGTPA